MKAVLEFQLPEDTGEFETATRAPVIRSFLSEFEVTLRSRVKYGSHGSTSWADVEKLWYDLKQEYRIE